MDKMLGENSLLVMQDMNASHTFLHSRLSVFAGWGAYFKAILKKKKFHTRVRSVRLLSSQDKGRMSHPRVQS